MTASPAQPNEPLAVALEPGLLAARKRLRPPSERPVTQADVAEAVGATLSSYRRWERGEATPRDPEMIAALVEYLKTPLEVLWPPEDHPYVGRALLAMRQARAEEEQQQVAVESVPRPAAASAPEPPSPTVPDIDDVLATVDAGRRPRGRWRSRLRVPAVAVLLVGTVAAAGVVLASAGGGEDSDTAPPPAPAAQVTQTAVRQQLSVAMAAAAERKDFNQAVEFAGRLDDAASVARYEHAAAAVWVRRAAAAAKRGDLPLARKRLNEAVGRYAPAASGDNAAEARRAGRQRLRQAEQRYGSTPSSTSVEATIRRIEQARAARAAKRRAEARRREARRRAQATASTPAAPAPASSSPAPGAPAPSQPTPQPAPQSPPTGQSSSGSSSGSSSPGSSDRNCDNAECGLDHTP